MAQQASKGHSKLNEKVAYPQCRISVTNAFPDGADFYITELDVKFFYADGSNEIVGSGQSQWGPGQTVTVVGTKTLCCKATLSIIGLNNNGNPDSTESNEAADSGKCLTDIPYVLRPQNQVPEGVPFVGRRFVLDNGHAII